MEFRPSRSILARLLVSAAVMVAIVTAFQAFFVPWRIGVVAEDSLEAKANTVTDLLSHSAREALGPEGSIGEVQEEFTQAVQDEDIDYLVFYEPSGRRLASVQADEAPALSELQWADSASPMDDRVVVTRSIQASGGRKGLLVAGYNTDRVQDQLDLNHQFTLLYGLVMLLCGGGLALYLGRLIGTRMSKLSRAAKEISGGRLDMEPFQVTLEDELGRMALSFNDMLLLFKALQDHFDQVAGGDLSQDVSVQGDLAQAFQRMVERQRDLVRQIQATAAEMRSSSAEILASSRSQERGAAEQAAVVEQTLRTMETLLDATTQIADSSQTVLDNAERTHENIELIAERVSLLASHTQRISEVLEVIKDIANKTDLLALNASLEGTRAGEAGRGFSQVAVRMQRLTENVMGAVRDIKSLTVDIREATGASVLATEEASKRASSSAESARLIRYTIQQQQSGTQQVTQSMDEISEVIQRTVSSSAQLSATASQLSELSERMSVQVEEFRLPDATSE